MCPLPHRRQPSALPGQGLKCPFDVLLRAPTWRSPRARPWDTAGRSSHMGSGKRPHLGSMTWESQLNQRTLRGSSRGPPHVWKHVSRQPVSCPTRYPKRLGDRTCAFPNELDSASWRQGRAARTCAASGGRSRCTLGHLYPLLLPPPPHRPLWRPLHRPHAAASPVPHPTALPRRGIPGSVPPHPKASRTPRAFQAPLSR